MAVSSYSRGAVGGVSGDDMGIRAAAAVNSAGGIDLQQGCTITKNAVGVWTVTLSPAFSSAVNVVPVGTAGSNTTAAGSISLNAIVNGASSVTIRRRLNGSNPVFQDGEWHVAFVDAGSY